MEVFEDVDPEFSKYDDIINVYKYKMDDHWTAGSFLILTLSEVSPAKTQLNIEMQRVIGAYDTESELHFANKHISMFLESISKLLQKNDSELSEVEKSESLHEPSSGCTMYLSIFFIIVIIAVIIIVSR